MIFLVPLLIIMLLMIIGAEDGEEIKLGCLPLLAVIALLFAFPTLRFILIGFGLIVAIINIFI